MELVYQCGRPCQEQDWVSLDGRLGYIEGDGWRMCMGTGFEWCDELDLWVAYPLFRNDDGLWRYEVVPIHELVFVRNEPCYDIPTSPS